MWHDQCGGTERLAGRLSGNPAYSLAESRGGFASDDNNPKQRSAVAAMFHRLFSRMHYDMSRLLLSIAFVCVASSCFAHHPDRANAPVRPRVDCIGPIGNRLPPSYRLRYNRPTNLGGHLAYVFAPTSQEAMAWHNAKHRGNYKNKMPRTVMQYFYPKPWELLNMTPQATMTEAPDPPVPVPVSPYRSPAPRPEPVLEPVLEPAPAELPPAAPAPAGPNGVDTSNLPQSVIDILSLQP
jgi:hypothetical protein